MTKEEFAAACADLADRYKNGESLDSLVAELTATCMQRPEGADIPKELAVFYDDLLKSGRIKGRSPDFPTKAPTKANS